MDCKNPWSKFLLVIHFLSAILAITMGGFLIDMSAQVDAYVNLMETLDVEHIDTSRKTSDLEALNFLYYCCSVLGSLAIVMSIAFIWSAYDVAVLLWSDDKYLNNRKVKTESSSSEKAFSP